MKKVGFRDKTGMGLATMAKSGKNKLVSMDVILRICNFLKCDVGDIMEVIPEENDEKI